MYGVLDMFVVTQKKHNQTQHWTITAQIHAFLNSINEFNTHIYNSVQTGFPVISLDVYKRWKILLDLCGLTLHMQNLPHICLHVNFKFGKNGKFD